MAQAQMARQAEQDPTNLYIANLPHTVKESDLEQMFSPYGQVISTRILRDSNQQSRGVGFARYIKENFYFLREWSCIISLPGWRVERNVNRSFPTSTTDLWLGLALALVLEDSLL